MICDSALLKVHLPIWRLHQALAHHEVHIASILADHNLLVLEPYHEAGEACKSVGKNAFLCEPCFDDTEP